jgi:hypothetical protein
MSADNGKRANGNTLSKFCGWMNAGGGMDGAFKKRGGVLKKLSGSSKGAIGVIDLKAHFPRQQIALFDKNNGGGASYNGRLIFGIRDKRYARFVGIFR